MSSAESGSLSLENINEVINRIISETDAHFESNQISKIIGTMKFVNRLHGRASLIGIIDDFNRLSFRIDPDRLEAGMSVVVYKRNQKSAPIFGEYKIN
jgi:hypothetical protein